MLGSTVFLSSCKKDSNGSTTEPTDESMTDEGYGPAGQGGGSMTGDTPVESSATPVSSQQIGSNTVTVSEISGFDGSASSDLGADPDDASSNTRWQYDLSFPDWQNRSMNGANNRLAFYGYSRQGKIYITLQPGTGSFSLYINDTKIDTSAMTEGKTYSVNFESIARNGQNTLQVSNLSTGKVNIRIPYPTIKTGTYQDAGISPKAIDLIDRIISEDIAHGYPSAQIAIVRHGRLVYSNSWGNIQTYDEKGDPVSSAKVTNDTLYDLASVTKMFSVNYALQYLVTQGKADIDMKVSDILGAEFYENTVDYKYSEGDKIPLETNKQYKADLTIRDILKHMGGFPAGPITFSDSAPTKDPDAARAATLREICKTPLMYKPGTKALYSDLDYMILCFCVEKLTGQPLDAFLRETFWEPLGLTHITYNPTKNGFARENCVATELKENHNNSNPRFTDDRQNPIQGEVHDPNAYYCMGGVSGHAGLFANASDLAILASVMLTGGYGEHRFFSQNVIDMFTSIQELDSSGYGLGWWREGDHTRDNYYGSTSDSNVYGHQGFTGTLAVIDPENDMVIVILSNKIHSKVLKGDKATYAGNVYTTASLGFVPQILQIGLDGKNVDDAMWRDLVSDMAEDISRTNEKYSVTDREHPRWKAYDALIAVKEKMNGG